MVPSWLRTRSLWNTGGPQFEEQTVGVVVCGAPRVETKEGVGFEYALVRPDEDELVHADPPPTVVNVDEYMAQRELQSLDVMID